MGKDSTFINHILRKLKKTTEDSMGTIANFEKHNADAVSAVAPNTVQREELMRSGRVVITRLTIPVGGFMEPMCNLYTRKRILCVEGCAAVNMPTGAVRLLEEEEVTVAAGIYHRVENHGKIPMTAIEIRTGITDVDDSYTGISDMVGQL
jgi:mannose-6-phosphate isomerase-like protein (cupin superfamily)